MNIIIITGGKSMTNTERVRRWRHKERAKGRKFVSFLLSLEATKKLRDIQGRTGESISQIIERLLLGKGPAGVNLDTVGKIKDRMTPERQQLMNLIRQLRVGEGLSHKQIAEYLEEKDEPTISGRGRWQQGSVGKLLKKWDIP